MRTADPDLAAVKALWSSNLDAMMAKRAMSAVELAERVGRTTGSINFYRSGHALPSPPTAVRICRALGVTGDGRELFPLPLDEDPS